MIDNDFSNNLIAELASKYPTDKKIVINGKTVSKLVVYGETVWKYDNPHRLNNCRYHRIFVTGTKDSPDYRRCDYCNKKSSYVGYCFCKYECEDGEKNVACEIQ